MKNKGYANFGGQIRCIMGDVQVANGDDFSFSCKYISLSQERLCTWPYFEIAGFWNSEVAY